MKRGVTMDYKKIIIEMVQQIDDEKFLKQLYTILIGHIRKIKN